MEIRTSQKNSSSHELSNSRLDIELFDNRSKDCLQKVMPTLTYVYFYES